MESIDAHARRIQDFAKARDWEKFHTPKNLSMALAAEAGELLAEFQWLTAEESQELDSDKVREVSFELADIAIYLFRICDILRIDLDLAIKEKMKLNEIRFPPIK